MTESEMYQRHLKTLFKNKGIYFRRFELERIPDLYLACRGRVLWAELKTINKPSTIVKPDWRPGQLAFMTEHKPLGGDIFCLILHYVGGIYFLPPKKQYLKEELVCQKKTYLKKLMGL
jgi:hypothetical protein